jgi:hypothetical protein
VGVRDELRAWVYPLLRPGHLMRGGEPIVGEPKPLRSY